MAEVLGVITARGGSKGIPGKNLAQVAGRPLIAWTVEQALAARALDRVIVSTDDTAIAEACRVRGAEVPFLRPAELAGDDSPHEDVLRHAVAWAEEQGMRPDLVVLLQPTSPLRLASDIDAAVDLARERNAGSVYTVAPAPHPWLLRTVASDGRMESVAEPPGGYLRRQDMPPVAAPNGAVYVVSRDMLMERGLLRDEHTLALTMPAERSLDVDEPHDLALADALLRRRLEASVPVVRIGGFEIGPDRPCMVIAEAGVNHNGSLERALAMVDAAAGAGAHAVKFQTFRAEELAAPGAPKAAYQARTTGDGTQLDMLRGLELSFEDHEAIARRCRDKGILFMSSCFGPDDVDLLETVGVAAHKIPSGELTNAALLARAGATGKPVILSTGMARMDEVLEAVRVLRDAGCRELVLLHCVSAYPADPADANLRAMEALRLATGVPVGFSDHSAGVHVAVAASALGACLVEKHFTLDRSLPGPDHAASLEPGELAELARGVAQARSALGHGRKEPAAVEADTSAVARRSLTAARDIRAGEPLVPDMVALRRPGTGLPGSALDGLTGRVAVARIPAGTLLEAGMFKDLPKEGGS